MATETRPLGDPRIAHGYRNFGGANHERTRYMSISAVVIASFSIAGLSMPDHLAPSNAADRPIRAQIARMATTMQLHAAPNSLIFYVGDDPDNHDRILAPGQDYDQEGQRGNRGKNCSMGGFGGRGGHNGSFDGGQGGNGGNGGVSGNGGKGGDGGSFGGGKGGNGGKGGVCAA